MDTVESRSYSRNSGRISLETETGSPSRRTARAAVCWFEAFANEKRKQMAKDSTRARRTRRTSSAISRELGRRRTFPPAPILSAIPQRRSRGTSGGSTRTLKSYSFGRFCLAISIRSSKPAVVTRPTRAPRRSSRLLVPTVVPWTISSFRASAPPRSSRIPSTMPRPGSSGVEKTLAMRTSPSSMTTQSVNVPPVSTPMRMGFAAPSPSRRGGVSRKSLASGGSF